MSQPTSGNLSTQDNIKISFDHYKNGHKQVIVVAHGFYTSKAALLFKELSESLIDDYDIILFDFRGHGRSEGCFTWTSKEYLDLLTVLEYAHQNYSTISVVGFSLGAATSIITASKTNLINSLIAISAPTRFWKIDYHPWALDFETDIIYNLFGEGRIGKRIKSGPFWERKERPIDLVEKINIPILYIHGTKDWVIRPWHAKALYEKTKSQKKLALIQGGLHAEYLIRKNKKETVDLIRDWFKIEDSTI